MWLLLIVFIALPCGESKGVIYTTHLDSAMRGHDPFFFRFVQPDPGRRGKIFNPIKNPITSTDDEVIPNKFIEESEEERCFPDLISQTVTNYIEFLKYVTSSAYQISSGINYASPMIRPDCSTTCDIGTNTRDHTMQQFFENTDGEVVFVSVECCTRTITLNPFEPLVFTPSFETALSHLYNAALNSDSEASDRTFSDFVWTYGTHFSKRTRLGAKTILGKVFSSRAVTVEEETARRECVLQAAREALRPCKRRCNETTVTHFARAASERCGEPQHQVLVSVIGPLPEGTIENWASVAEEVPEPIFHFLESIATIFRRQWSTSNSETMKIDKTILHDYFQRKIVDYNNNILTVRNEEPSQEVSGETCPALTKSIKECVPKYGGALIIGGFRDVIGDLILLSSGEAIGTTALPDLPTETVAVTLTVVGTKVYSCGGWHIGNVAASECYVIDRTANSSRWNATTPLPTAKFDHTSVTIKDHIWTVYDGKLHDLDTKSNELNTFLLPLTVTQLHCAVSNGSHSFIIGAGSKFDEIWVNTKEYDPARWHRVGRLRAGRRGFGCVWFEQEVFITGGQRHNTEVFDTQTHSLRSVGTLVQARVGHRMMVLDGRPAVVGGRIGYTTLSSIETYDHSTGKWETSSQSLLEERAYFGLVQLHA